MKIFLRKFFDNIIYKYQNMKKRYNDFYTNYSFEYIFKLYIILIFINSALFNCNIFKIMATFNFLKKIEKIELAIMKIFIEYIKKVYCIKISSEFFSSSHMYIKYTIFCIIYLNI